MKVFFDLDPAVYMSGFSAQSKIYTIVYWEEDLGIQEKVFEDGNAKNKWLREIKEQELDIEIEDQEFHLIVESESHARQAARTVIESALRELKRRFKTDDLEVYYFLTGKGNFRESLATIAEYKGNRKDIPKPHHYAAIRDYYIDHWGAYVVEGIEADDEVSIRAWEEYRDCNQPHPSYVIATIDKDLDQIPGWHYDYKKHVFYEVDALDGEMFFYAQTIAGDATDNIKGCYRIGITKAKALVDAWFDEAVESQQDWRFYVWDMVVQTYQENMEKYPDKYPEGMSAEDAATENARLVYMMQERDELWTPSMSGSKGKA
jgi:hypothetical protein